MNHSFFFIRFVSLLLYEKSWKDMDEKIRRIHFFVQNHEMMGTS